MTMARMAMVAALALAASGCEDGSDDRRFGPNPALPAPERGLLPSMTIPEPTGWGDRRPVVPDGFAVQAIATGLKIPRQILVLPNGDILVAEGKGGAQAPALRPKDIIAGFIKSQGTSSVKGGDRLTLLRDADGDGNYETRTVFADGLNAPYGLALIGNRLFVANQDALVRLDYQPGQLRASGPAVEVAALPAAINHHWTKALTASADGRYLYVGIGSNSNIGERGMAVEENRAMIWEVDAETGAVRPYATGLRNPTALAVQPETGRLWAVVNERDEIGPNLVPDYLTTVREGGFYGWPYAYWGANADRRVRPFREEMVARTIRPDYSLGSHHAPLGIAFSNAAMGPRFADGVFIGEHGSWNRERPVGYRVSFVPFRRGWPSGQPIPFVSGFLAEGRAYGRPVGVAVDPRGALLVADDLSNTIWRVTPARTVNPTPVTP